jgi:hypothetical protein
MLSAFRARLGRARSASVDGDADHAEAKSPAAEPAISPLPNRTQSGPLAAKKIRSSTEQAVPPTEADTAARAAQLKKPRSSVDKSAPAGGDSVSWACFLTLAHSPNARFSRMVALVVMAVMAALGSQLGATYLVECPPNRKPKKRQREISSGRFDCGMRPRCSLISLRFLLLLVLVLVFVPLCCSVVCSSV